MSVFDDLLIQNHVPQERNPRLLIILPLYPFRLAEHSEVVSDPM